MQSLQYACCEPAHRSACMHALYVYVCVCMRTFSSTNCMHTRIYTYSHTRTTPAIKFHELTHTYMQTGPLAKALTGTYLWRENMPLRMVAAKFSLQQTIKMRCSNSRALQGCRCAIVTVFVCFICASSVSSMC
jgi:hypothetical protein